MAGSIKCNIIRDASMRQPRLVVLDYDDLLIPFFRIYFLSVTHPAPQNQSIALTQSNTTLPNSKKSWQTNVKEKNYILLIIDKLIQTENGFVNYRESIWTKNILGHYEQIRRTHTFSQSKVKVNGYEQF